MYIDDAWSLADYINDNNTRFHAVVLDFAERGWVIVTDRQAENSSDAYQEPIVDPRDYLRRADHGLLQIDGEYRCLLETWLLSPSMDAKAGPRHPAELMV
jgi:hypothetical protein